MAVLILFSALRAPSKDWLVDYYPNPDFAGPAQARAWVRRASLRVPGELLISHVPDRPEFSLRFQSCLPVAEPTELLVRLTAEDRARLYVDDQLVVDSGVGAARPSTKKKSKGGKGRERVALPPGTHRVMLEYSNAGGPAAVRLELSEQGLKATRFQSRLRRPSLDGRCDNP